MFPSPVLSSLTLIALFAGTATAGFGQASVAASYKQTIAPLLDKYCYDCHGGGISKGGVTLDEFKSEADILGGRERWHAVLRNVRSGMMPPSEEGVERPTAAEVGTLTNWIKYEALGIDPRNPDPGHVRPRRLNRVEYRNTVRDLTGYDFNSEVEFPPDDSGGGFDNNGDVLTVSPLLLEKYLAAAEIIVEKAVPKVAKIVRERTATGREFRAESGGGTGDQMNARRAVTVSRAFTVEKADKYHVAIEFESRGSFDFDPSRCRLICRIDGEERFAEEIVWSERKTMRREFELAWEPGRHVVAFEIAPLAPAEGKGAPAASGTNVSVRIGSVTVRGPLSPEHWMPPENYERFFPRGPAPADAAGRERYARELLGDFAGRAFRRPASEEKIAQLVGLARQTYELPGKTFEEGVGRAMMAVLGSPRFLFRIEEAEPAATGGRHAPLDEHSLASRLSYFLWSTMPDAELLRLAGKGELRRNLRPQVERMLKDPKAQAFVRHFTGQWLQARDVESVPINARVVLGPDAPRNRDGRIEFDSEMRKFMRSETEMYFEHVLRGNRSVLELVDSDYAFLNERLAEHYGVPGVKGAEMRLVTLPAGSPRGGILTQGTVLSVTSNPTRTSPVKRGLFILENILGVSSATPPPNVPDLEESKKEFKGGREPKLSEILALHRADKLCNSCHSRMDPLGLALENFNALGGWRETDAGQPIEPAGQLMTGEKFADVRELKKVMTRDRATDIYRCLTEKLMAYALGRGLDYFDAHTVDEIAGRLARSDGRIGELIMGVVESPAFQMRRASVEGARVSASDVRAP